MPDYSNGKIYKLCSYQCEDVYVGSTIQPLAKRKGGHISEYKRWLIGHKYMSSFEICKYDDMYIELIESFPCNSKEELNRREGQLIRELKCVNKRISGRTKTDYRIENREILNDKSKKYYNDNRIKINEILNRKFNCDCGGKYTKVHKSRHIKSKKHQAYLESLTEV